MYSFFKTIPYNPIISYVKKTELKQQSSKTQNFVFVSSVYYKRQVHNCVNVTDFYNVMLDYIWISRGFIFDVLFISFLETREKLIHSATSFCECLFK